MFIKMLVKGFILDNDNNSTFDDSSDDSDNLYIDDDEDTKIINESELELISKY